MRGIADPQGEVPIDSEILIQLRQISILVEQISYWMFHVNVLIGRQSDLTQSILQ